LSILVEKEKGLNIYLLSTPKGILEASSAVKKKLSGELLCKITI
jgi:ribosomal protein S8